MNIISRKVSALILWLPLLSFAQGDTRPCWLQSPQVDESLYGYIGTANAHSIYKNGSILSSRKKALKQLIQFEDLAINDHFTDDNILQPNIQLIDNITAVFFDEYTEDGVLYSFVVPLHSQHKDRVQDRLEEWKNKRCTNLDCDFNNCSPAWLCDSFHRSSVLGISNITVNPSEQLQQAQKSGQALLSYMASSNVDYEAEIKSKQQNESFAFNLRENKAVTSSLQKDILLRPVKQCWGKSYVFSWMQSQLTLQSDTLLKPFNEWKQDPFYGEELGVIGIFDAYETTGRFSNRVELAVKNGLVEIANNRQVKIKQSQLIVTKKDNVFYLSSIKAKSKAIVSARLLDIKVIENDDKLVVYSWLLPI